MYGKIILTKRDSFMYRWCTIESRQVRESQGASPMVITTEKVWEEFHPRLKQFILKRIPDEQNAEDILQEVFLKIHARIGTLRDEEKLQSWMYQITRNVIADYYREHKATVALTEALLL